MSDMRERWSDWSTGIAPFAGACVSLYSMITSPTGTDWIPIIAILVACSVLSAYEYLRLRPGDWRAAAFIAVLGFWPLSQRFTRDQQVETVCCGASFLIFLGLAGWLILMNRPYDPNSKIY